MLMALVPVALACALELSNLFFNSSFAEEALLRRNLCDYLSCILMFASYATLIVTARLSSVLLRCCIATCDVQQRRCRAVRACFGFWGGGGGRRDAEPDHKVRRARLRAQEPRKWWADHNLCSQGPRARQSGSAPGYRTQHCSISTSDCNTQVSFADRWVARQDCALVCSCRRASFTSR